LRWRFRKRCDLSELAESSREEARDLAYAISDILDETKGENIIILYLGEVCSFTDYFVLCTGGSDRTLNALADAVKTQVKKDRRLKAMKIEGDAQSGWILLDYGDVILHLFSPKLREYYRLEELWREGKVLVHIQ
jgi:ribosome-associated protein